MDDEQFNPFADLDKSRFPKDRKRPEPAKPKPAPLPPRPPEVRSGEQEEDEGALFGRAMAGVAPLEGSGRQVHVESEAPPGPDAADSDGEAVRQLQDFVDGKIEFTLEFSNEYVEARVDGLDPRMLAKLKTGRLSPEAHLDLHGQNALQAYTALVRFIKEHYLEGRRCVLLIPGRGRNSPEGYAVLRDKVQSWLTRDPLKRVVLAFTTALPKHGGAGALYVLLRKYKKSRGKIVWDRTPLDEDLL